MNPYTGKKLGYDEIGPLYFDIYSLYKYYFDNRLNIYGILQQIIMKDFMVIY